uniref:peptidase domain-containing ABC transporter n=1 Tax=Candidatus Ruminimicrobium bovinum TaxID=3242779 RepID=UPI0039B92669
ISSRNFIYFIPNKIIPIIKEENLIKNKINEFIFFHKNSLLTIIIFSILFVLFSIILSFEFQFVIERSINLNSSNNLLPLITILLFIYLIKNTLDYSKEKLLNFISTKLDCILINDSLNHILSLPHLYFKNRTTGEVLSRISDLDNLKNIICNLLITVLVDLLIFIVSIITLFFINIKLTLFTLGIIIISSLITLIYNNYIYHDIRELKENNAKVNSNIIELINGINTIKSLNILEKIKEKFSHIYNKFLLSNYNFSNKLTNKKLIENITTSIISLLILFIGGGLVLKGDLKLSSLITFNSIIFYHMSSLKNILDFTIMNKQIKLTIERINELLNIKEEKIYFDLNPLRNIKGDVIVKSLSYKYGTKEVINNLNIVFKEGKKILIHGSSGSGKSTLAKLISGYLEIQRGKIQIGNLDINEINLWSLREQITYVSQDEYLFNDTLYENLNIKNTRDKNKIYDIGKCMLLNDFVSNNPSGYNMILDENACNLSGGERQRVILARAFLKNSNIFILDESFSEINVDKERKILTNIFNYFKEKTIIVISHRFDNNDLYDEVCNLEDYGFS